MEIKEGMYVRTRWGIAKVNNIEGNALYLDTNLRLIDETRCHKSDVIGEPSYEIIDVIKSDDIVNGRVVENVIYQMYEQKGDKLIGLGNKVVVFGWRDYINRNMIFSVVTKEQLDAMAYINEHDPSEGMNDPETQEMLKKNWEKNTKKY